MLAGSCKHHQSRVKWVCIDQLLVRAQNILKESEHVVAAARIKEV